MLKFELLKIYREKTIYILSAVLALVIFAPFLIGNSQLDMLEYYENNYQANSTTIEDIKDDPTAAGTIKDIKEVNGYLGEMIKAIKNGNDKENVNSELKYENKNLEDMTAGKLDAGPLVDQKAKVVILKYLNDKSIEKISNNVKDIGSINYLSMIVSTPQIVLIILILISLHLVYIFNLDYRKNNFMVYNSSPKSYLQIFFTKFSANMLSEIVNMASVFTLVLSIVGMKNGLGVSRYPIATIQNNSDVSIISTSDFLLKVFTFLFLFLIFSGLLALFVSLLSSNLIVNISLIILPLILGQYDLLNTFLSENVKPFIILSYIDISLIIMGGNGFYPITNPAITFNNGILLLSLSVGLLLIVLFYLLSNFPKKLIYTKFLK
ncbi:hypothetical protein CYV26_00075 [Carnobacterium maltaromaticum]|uniref:hypothetical protein n=1 Tax=Carnobacterium maltaromaticum TaxID=2751 RepID=UPI000C773895|nr:hypothetical protein [Carnobacterium maltaromaticum]PLS37162.1 hypothetical protein CYV33_06435 [Carnobacterium maltaromaticum]PLS37976.1 hypothetical protein CYV30_06430 [Carnobacterium maltaromaticum]PLS39917.1 hypothetical protein CYV31_04415 [Carnobacterium maltaromaticum]PLS44674.1 hypothetical protein CYV28_06435 [Carnobacterium maltaromaticum]PLS46706.1 hypothetical protein CYV27_06425 [Carnobacterium maltaromaticum]